MSVIRFWTFKARSSVYGLLATLCFAAGVASRFYGAWACRYIGNPDTGIVALMVKHMAEGRDWPVFFYGQAYMGTLEPMISVAFTSIFGITGFAVCAGTALAAVCSLPVVFFWARDAAGRAGALTTLALCAVGPYYYFMFQFAPRGGYTVTLLLGLLVMWLSTRTAVRIHSRRESAPAWFLLIGVLAGLGWWTNPLITPSLLAGAAILAIGLHGRVWQRGPLLGLLGFLLGSLPFWAWNMGHEWASFDMFSSVGKTGTLEGLRLFWQRYDRLIGLEALSRIPRTLVLATYPLLAALGLVTGLIRLRKRQFTMPSASALTLSVFMLASMVIFVRSSFASMNTARYLVPLVPAAAILAGLFVQRLCTVAGPIAAAIPVVLLITTQWPAIQELHARSVVTPSRRNQDTALGNFLQKKGIEAVYSHFMDHTLNFNLDESVVVTDMRGDRYPAYSRHAEMADRIAVVRNFGHIAEFPGVAGGKMTTENAGGYGVRYDFSPPADALTDITDTMLSRVLDRKGKDSLRELTDLNIDTDWVGKHATSGPEWLELQFAAPVILRRLRLVGMGVRPCPARARIEIKRSRAAPWEIMYDTHVVTDFFWSGPRPYWGGRRHRIEYSFDDTAVAAVRVVSVAPRGLGGSWRVSEIRCFGPGPELPEETASLPSLMDLLRIRNIRTLYCDRWVSNRVHQDSGGSVNVEMEPSFFPESPLRGGSVNLHDQPAFLVKNHDRAVMQKVLAQRGIQMLETEVGPWVLLEAASIDAADTTVNDHETTLYWTGLTLLNCSEASPTTAVRVEFPQGMTLIGFTVTPSRVEPGGEFEVTWFWRLVAPLAKHYPCIFVHFKHDKEMFQDDHMFFGPESTWRAGAGGQSNLLWDRRTVPVPLDAEPGKRDIHMGLYDPLYSKRFRPQTDLPTTRRAVVLKNAFTIVHPKERRD